MNHNPAQLRAMDRTEIMQTLGELLYGKEHGILFKYEDWSLIMPAAAEYGVILDAKRKMAWIEEPYGTNDVLFKYVTEESTAQRAVAHCLIMVLEGAKQ